MTDGAAGEGREGGADVDVDARVDAGLDSDVDADPGPGSERERLAVDFGADGLVPAVAQDAATGEVLMLAYASPEAVARTVETGRAHYHSRSRDELWEKGATSGHTQSVREVRVDCDGDALLYRVEQAGGACHTGFGSCFHRTVEDATVDPGGGDAGAAALEYDDAGTDGPGTDAAGVTLTVRTTGERAFDPEDVY
jgi:phosphoribosyl-AMP cyclohydrolase